MASIKFIGAAKTTTGSKHLLTWKGKDMPRRLLVDCGMFQGLKELRLMNWNDFPVSPEIIDAVILTHGHFDHCGYLPKLVKEGFDGPIYATRATIDLATLILHDSAHIQMEEAKHAKKWGYSKHEDPQPLYTDEDVEKVLPLFQPLDYNRSYDLLENLTVRLHHSGHILGSAFIEATVMEDGKPVRIAFSGDVGRFKQPILRDPEPPTGADYFLLEGTYGERTHGTGEPKTEIAEVVNRTVERGGTVVIPAFAVGRSQQLLYYLAELLEEGKIEPIDIFLDSPMAVRMTRYTTKHIEELDLQTRLGVKGEKIFRRPEMHLVEKVDDSKKLNERTDPCIIISASGMATAGRILHHLKRRITDARNTILLVGYQGEGTRGRRLLEGEKEIKIHGQMHPVNAEVINMSSLSAHADYTEMLPWLRRMVPPAVTFLVHGEEKNLEAFHAILDRELGWNMVIPNRNDEIELTPVNPNQRIPAKQASAEAAAEALPKTQPIVIVGVSEDALPAGLVIDKVFPGTPDGELAKQILAETDGETVYLVGTSDEKSAEFTRELIKAGRHVWRMMQLT